MRERDKIILSHWGCAWVILTLAWKYHRNVKTREKTWKYVKKREKRWRENATKTLKYTWKNVKKTCENTWKYPCGGVGHAKIRLKTGKKRWFCAFGESKLCFWRSKLHQKHNFDTFCLTNIHFQFTRALKNANFLQKRSFSTSETR